MSCDKYAQSEATRFISLGKMAHSDHRGEIRQCRKRDSGAYRTRAYGKAPTLSTTDPGTLKRAIDMTDDELAAIVARAKLTVVK
jgi:hypothetical protein